MKKYFCISLISLFFLSCGELSYQQNLDNMGGAVRQHFKYKNQESEIKTQIELLNAVSYAKLQDSEKLKTEDAYLCKVYLVAKSSHVDSYRVYNVNDTIDAYFDKDMRFLRIETKKVNG